TVTLEQGVVAVGEALRGRERERLVRARATWPRGCEPHETGILRVRAGRPEPCRRPADRGRHVELGVGVVAELQALLVEQLDGRGAWPRRAQRPAAVADVHELVAGG